MKNIVRLARPFHLFLVALTYGLGVAISNYLASPFSISAFILGISWTFLVQGSMNLLAEVFRPSNEAILPGQHGAERVYFRDRLLFISMGLLILASGFIYLLFLFGHLSPASLLMLGLSLVAVLLYSVPPFKLYRRGYGELLQSIHMGYIVPSLGFVLQAGEFHRYLLVLTLPITLLALAYFLVVDFSTFAEDIKYERVTLLTRLGWQSAIPIHHALVSAAFILLAVLPFAGLSPGMLWPVVFVIPFAIIQVRLLHAIGLGAHPNWRLLTIAAATVFAMTAYLLASSFFLR